MAKVTVRVARASSEGSAATARHFETHEVQAADKACVLDLLFALQRGPCPELAFRFSCRVGMCGSCAMVVNGRERLACSTLVKEVGGVLRIEPLRNVAGTMILAVALIISFAAYQRSLAM